MSFGDTRIGRLDAKTNVAQDLVDPMTRSRPRRGRFDDQNRLWFAEYAANRIAMFDPKTEQNQRMEAADRLEPALRRGATTAPRKCGPGRC